MDKQAIVAKFDAKQIAKWKRKTKKQDRDKDRDERIKKWEGKK